MEVTETGGLQLRSAMEAREQVLLATVEIRSLISKTSGTSPNFPSQGHINDIEHKPEHAQAWTPPFWRQGIDAM